MMDANTRNLIAKHFPGRNAWEEASEDEDITFVCVEGDISSNDDWQKMIDLQLEVMDDPRCFVIHSEEE